MNFEVAKSKVIIQLLKGPLYRESSPTAWQHLLFYEAEVTDYYSHMGLSLFIHLDYGFAFLKQAITLDSIQLAVGIAAKKIGRARQHIRRPTRRS
jgi:hypothetical protein